MLFRYTLGRSVTPETRDRLLKTIPGVLFNSFNMFTAHGNCAFLLERALTAEQLPYRMTVVPEHLPLVAEPERIHASTWQKMYSYQRQAVDYGVRDMGSMLWAPAGAGKTVVGIVQSLQMATGKTAWVTKAVSAGKHCLDVGTWSTARVQRLKGRGGDELDPACEFYVLNWEILTYYCVALARVCKTVVFDEIQEAKNPRRHKSVPVGDGGSAMILSESMSASAKRLSMACKRRIGLTATPISNTVSDLYAQLDLIWPNMWGTKSDWMTRYADRHEGVWGGWIDNGSSNLAELRERVSRCVCWISDDQARKELPPFRREVVRIPQSELVSVDKRLEVRETAGMGTTETLLAMAAAGKKDAVFPFVQEAVDNNQKALVFVGRKPVARRWAADWRRSLNKGHKGLPEVVVLEATGDMTADMRVKEAQKYIDATGPIVMIATIDALGTAFDGLQCTHVALCAFLPSTPRKLIQMEGRVIRSGLLHSVIWRYFVASNTIDEHIAVSLLDKLPAVATIVGDDTGDDLGHKLFGSSDAEIEQKLHDMFKSPPTSAVDVDDIGV